MAGTTPNVLGVQDSGSGGSDAPMWWYTLGLLSEDLVIIWFGRVSSVQERFADACRL